MESIQEMMSRKLTKPEGILFQPDNETKNDAKIDALVNVITLVPDSKE